MMMSAEENLARTKRLRGHVLRYVYNGHRAQAMKSDDLMVWGFLMDLGFRVGQKETIATVQDLCERGYLKCTEAFDEREGCTHLRAIMITPAGRDLVEKLKRDEAIEV